jgi:hypothetical protein
MRAKRIWQDHDGKVVLWQRPNIWLSLWILAEIAGFIFKQGKAEETIRWTGRGAIIAWALLEISQGVNYFRRGLGMAVLLVTIVSILKS